MSLQRTIRQNIVDDILDAIRSVVVRLYTRSIPVEYHCARFFSVLRPMRQSCICRFDQLRPYTELSAFNDTYQLPRRSGQDHERNSPTLRSSDKLGSDPRHNPEPHSRTYTVAPIQ